MSESIIEFAGGEEVEMPNTSNGVEAIGKVNIQDSISRDVISSRLVRKVNEDIKLPNIVIDIRDVNDISVSPFALKSLLALNRENGDISVYFKTETAMEKVMKTNEDLKKVVVTAMRDLVSPNVVVYENVEKGKKAKKIGGDSIRSMRLNL